MRAHIIPTPDTTLVILQYHLYASHAWILACNIHNYWHSISIVCSQAPTEFTSWSDQVTLFSALQVIFASIVNISRELSIESGVRGTWQQDDSSQNYIDHRNITTNMVALSFYTPSTHLTYHCNWFHLWVIFFLKFNVLALTCIINLKFKYQHYVYHAYWCFHYLTCIVVLSWQGIGVLFGSSLFCSVFEHCIFNQEMSMVTAI